MMSCMGNCFAGDVAKSQARFSFRTSCRLAFSSGDNVSTAVDVPLLDFVVAFTGWEDEEKPRGGARVRHLDARSREEYSRIVPDIASELVEEVQDWDKATTRCRQPTMSTKIQNNSEHSLKESGS